MDPPTSNSKRWENSSALWLGEITETRGETNSRKQVAWTLTLFAEAPFPSAFGACVQYDAEEDVSKVIDTNHVNILQGTWDHNRQKLKLIEVSSRDDSKREYEAIIYEQSTGSDAMVCIRGSWRSQTASGTIFCCFDPDGTNAAGLWLGQALPDASLADFMIPTNPICWTLALLPSGALFGAGYFDDSGDVPGKPLLFFALSGRWNGISKTATLTKHYEKAAETAGFHVDYEAKLEGDHSASSTECWLRGSWKNPAGGSFGQFSARRQPPAGSLAAICLCHVCGRALKPGELRYNCAICLPLWCCCSACETSQRTEHSHPLAPEMVFRMQTARGDNCAAVVLDAFTRFESRPFIGTRTPNAAAFSWRSYGQIQTPVLNFAYGLRELGCKPRTCVLLCADLSITYLVSILGLLVHGAIIVPIHGAMEQIGIDHVLRKTAPSVCLVGREYLQKVREAMDRTDGQCPLVELQDFLPVVDANLSSDDWRVPSRNSAVALDKLLSAGRRARGPRTSIDIAPVKRDDVSAVLFTSGSTGVPKGAIFTEDLVMPSEGVATVQPFIRLDFQAFDPSFALSVLQTMHCGGQRLFTSGLATLMQDFELGRPTHIGATPALWNSLYQEFLTRVAADLRASPSLSRAEAEKQAASLLRRKLGNRLVVASSGGAPLAPEVLQFAKKHLQLDIVDLYGSRETGGIARDGIVYKALDVKLLSIPELGYLADGHPPRGEICVCSPRLIPGYYNDPEQTARAFIEIEGKRYYRTGDIGELISSEPKRLRVVDRCGAMLKLVQGEWVAPGRIEAILEQCPLVQQALVLGNPFQRALVAVVVPSKQFAAFWSAKDTESQQSATSRLLEELRFWCTHHRLRPIEIPQAVYLESECWTAENGLLTSTEKKRRPLLQQKYSDTRSALYSNLNKAASAAPTTPDLNEKLLAIVRQVLPPGVELTSRSTFAELGGDSLAAARLSLLLGESGVQVSVKDLYEYPLSHLSMLFDPSHRVAVPAAVQSSYRDWSSEWQLPADLKPANCSAAPKKKHVFVTGATGFLGPVLVAEILQQFPADSLVYCLVRAASQEAAIARLRSDMKRAGVLRDELFTSRVRVLQGELGSGFSKLSAEDYQMLCDSVSHIFHSGACVNMTLPYKALRGVNVTGTMEIITLASKAGASVTYVSTVAAIPSESSAEEDWIEPDLAKMEQKDGYGQSKVVAEQLLNAARRELKLDVRVVRPSAICGDTRTGYANQLDFGGLLLKACALVGGAVVDTPAVLHWIPVDLVARVTVALALRPSSAGRVFHLTTAGPALRDVLAAMQRLGCVISNMPKSLWRAKVLALPPSERSLYPLREMLANFDWSAAPTAAVPTARTEQFCASELGLTLEKSVSSEQLHRMLSYLKQEGFFAAAAAVTNEN